MARRGNIFRMSRDKDHHRALFRNLISSLIIEERIQTTEAKAKALKGLIDQVVNKAKKVGTRTREQLTSYLTSPLAVDKLYSDIIVRFKDRSSGYVRNIRVGTRRGDNTMMMLVEWVVRSEKGAVKSEEKTAKKKKDE